MTRADVQREIDQMMDERKLSYQDAKSFVINSYPDPELHEQVKAFAEATDDEPEPTK